MLPLATTNTARANSFSGSPLSASTPQFLPNEWSWTSEMVFMVAMPSAVQNRPCANGRSRLTV